MAYSTPYSQWFSLHGYSPPYETYDHVVLTSDVTWDPTVLDNETDLNIPNDNLIVDIDGEYYDARSSDIGEKRTQRIIAEIDRRLSVRALTNNLLQTVRCYGTSQCGQYRYEFP